MRLNRTIRYLLPNMITAVGLLFGLLALKASFEGRFVDAAWLIAYAVLTDRLDGFVARLVRGTSELGVQLDSFADFLNFGLSPAIILYLALVSEPALPFADGWGQWALLVSCALWIFGATFRLARYNITSDVPGHAKIFFGVPTTMAGGLLIMWFLTLVKYSEPGSPLAPDEPFGGIRLFGSAITTPAIVWQAFPVIVVVGGFLMASTLRMPKLGLTRSKAATGFVLVNVLFGYVCGFARIFPEYCIIPPTLWLVVFLVWGALSPEARSLRPPPLFPEVDPPPGAEPIRPEDDLVPEGETLDGDLVS